MCYNIDYNIDMKNTAKRLLTKIKFLKTVGITAVFFLPFFLTGCSLLLEKTADTIIGGITGRERDKTTARVLEENIRFHQNRIDLLNSDMKGIHEDFRALSKAQYEHMSTINKIYMKIDYKIAELIKKESEHYDHLTGRINQNMVDIREARYEMREFTRLLREKKITLPD